MQASRGSLSKVQKGHWYQQRVECEEDLVAGSPQRFFLLELVISKSNPFEDSEISVRNLGPPRALQEEVRDAFRAGRVAVELLHRLPPLHRHDGHVDRLRGRQPADGFGVPFHRAVS